MDNLSGDTLACQRDLFEIPDSIVYLNCAYMSPLMTAAREAGEAGLARKLSPWRLTPPDFFTETEVARDLFARIVGARADDIAIIPAAGYGISVAARNVKVAAGQTIVTLAEQFPANIYPWQKRALAERASVLTVPHPEAGSWTDAVLDTIDDRTAVAALPHCHWITGEVLDLVRIRAACDAVGAALVIDGTQSVGALPFDVKEVRPDFLAVATYKWLLGPYSMGFLYVDPRWQGGEPLEENWIARKDSEAFGKLTDYEDAYEDGARRFDVGERANFALMPAVIAALRQILDWQVPRISRSISVLTRRLADGLEGEAFAVPPMDGRASHYFYLPWPGNAGDLQGWLAKRDMYMSARVTGLRITPHLYNTSDDVDRFVAALVEARSAGI